MAKRQLKTLFSKGYNRPAPFKEVKVDEYQQECITTSENHVLVVAGAGSGKTTVITERVKYLLINGVQPQNIVAITFTNLAAEEMKERLRNVQGIGDTFIGTIHSFANRIMKNSGEKYKLLTSDVETEYFKVLIKKWCKFLTFDRFLEYQDLSALVEVGRASEKSLESFLSPSEGTELRLLTRPESAIEEDDDYPETIEKLCKRDNVITFDELIERAEAYFRSIGASVEHLLVDEFQDIGTHEYNFIKGLNAENNFFVGDDYQSIYGFKGGNVCFFLQCMEDENFTSYILNNNYRNATAILELADKVISQVGNKINKEINQMSAEKGKVEIYTKWQLKKIIFMLSQEGSYKDWFILTRTNKELFEIAQLCEEYAVPHVTFRREGLSLVDLRGKLNSNKVKILTVHTSKGLESKNVILYGNFPVQCPYYLKKDEERKVMYVGITRAKENLILLN